MKTAAQERVHRLGKVRAYLEAAETLLQDANQTVPQSHPTEDDREAILALHVQIRSGIDRVRTAINQCDRIEP